MKVASYTKLNCSIILQTLYNRNNVNFTISKSVFVENHGFKYFSKDLKLEMFRR